MSIKYKELLNNLKAEYLVSKKRDFDKSEIQSYAIFRPLSFFITPLFLMAGFSANFVTFLSLLLFIIAGILCFNGAFYLGIVFCFLAALLDYVDGNIARYHRKTNYFGKFFDGVCGIVGVYFVKVCLVQWFFLKVSVVLGSVILIIVFLELITDIISYKFLLLNKEILGGVNPPEQLRVSKKIKFKVLQGFMQISFLYFLVIISFLQREEHLLFLICYVGYFSVLIALNMTKIFIKIKTWNYIKREY